MERENEESERGRKEGREGGREEGREGGREGSGWLDGHSQIDEGMDGCTEGQMSCACSPLKTMPRNSSRSPFSLVLACKEEERALVMAVRHCKLASYGNTHSRVYYTNRSVRICMLYISVAN